LSFVGTAVALCAEADNPVAKKPDTTYEAANL